MSSDKGKGKAGNDGGQSTDTDESSYQGWSDQGWRDSPTADSRPSFSSSDDPLPPYNDVATTPINAPSSRQISFSTTYPSHNMAHRRSTITRPTLHTAHSNVQLDAIGPSAYPASAVLNVGDVVPPTSGNTPLATTPFQPDHGYGSFPRNRRKSVGQHQTSAIVDTSAEEDTPASAHGKGKKKRARTTSFSLPFHRRRRLSNVGWMGWIDWLRRGNVGPKRPQPKPVLRWALLGLLAFTVTYGLILWKRAYELQVELSFFSHRWIKNEFDVIMPLKGCFDPQNVSPLYDMKRHLAPRFQMLSPGVSLKRGTACYDYSSTIQPVPDVEPEHVIYHTYWRSDLIPFGERHTATLASFLATQPLAYSKLILWTNGPAEFMANNTYVRPFVDKWPDNIEVRQVDMKSFTKGTELEGILSGADSGGLFDERAYVDGDAVRLLVLWRYGGIWLDMDQILTRDLHPLIEHEFVTQWDCYDKPYFALNGALMHFRKHSPYLCEAFHIMASSPLPKPNTFTWGSHLYAKLHRRLLAGRQKPFTVLPWCFADPRNCRADIRFPDPFGPDPESWGGRRWDGKGEVGRSGRELLEEKVGYVWSIHLHNQWKKDFPQSGWIQRLLQGYRLQIDAIERYTKAMGRTESVHQDSAGVQEERTSRHGSHRAQGLLGEDDIETEDV